MGSIEEELPTSFPANECRFENNEDFGYKLKLTYRGFLRLRTQDSLR